MINTELLSELELRRSFVDVLYLTNQNQMPAEIKHLLKERNLTHQILRIDKFAEVRNKLGLVGTVIVDAQGSDAYEQQKLAKIIETLEMENIGVILITDRVKVPVRSFSLAPTKSSFSMGGTAEAVSVDELWTRVSVNLAYRKKSEGMAVKPAIPPKQIQSIYKNKLAEQLSMASVLVDNLTEQLRLAGLVQQDFLPTQLPNTDKIKWATVFLPAEWVSGDIYNVVRIDEKHIGFYVADVVGHGMPAALLTIFVKQALVMRATVENTYYIFSPGEVMKNLNKRMAAQKLSGYQFATCCYCLLNTETLELTYARAGHPYPVLIRRGEEPKQLEVLGSLLGVFKDADYAEGRVQLQAGDKILLYSDGAEPFIGSFDDSAGFHFAKDFCELKDLPIVEMMDRFNTIAQNQTINPAEVDDITAIGFEIAG
ncbi:MAG: SpoIIE family protein phosphatase [Sedimentisphaerales bacterium]|jgi:serine phosphatase RsbU (regulator of sigma subunit)